MANIVTIKTLLYVHICMYVFYSKIIVSVHFLISYLFYYFNYFILCSFPLPEKFLDDNQHLFATDPFLLLLCVLASPLEEYNKLINKVPLFMLIAAMIEKVHTKNGQKVSVNLWIQLHGYYVAEIVNIVWE